MATELHTPSQGLVDRAIRYLNLNRKKNPNGGKSWVRVLIAFGEEKEGHLGLTAMTAEEAKERVKRWRGWKPFYEEISRIEFSKLAIEAEKEEKEIEEVLGDEWKENFDPETDPWLYAWPSTPWEKRWKEKRPYNIPVIGQHLTYRWRDILARKTCEWIELAENHPQGSSQGYRSKEAKQLFSDIEQVNRDWRKVEDWPDLYGEWDNLHVTPELYDEMKAYGEGRGVMSFATCHYCKKQILDEGTNVRDHVEACKLNPKNGNKFGHIPYVSCMDPETGYSMRIPGNHAGGNVGFRYFVGYGQGQVSKRLTLSVTYGKNGSTGNRMLGNVDMSTPLGEYKADNLPPLINDKLPQPEIFSFGFNQKKTHFSVFMDTDNYPKKISYNPSKNDEVYMRVEVEIEEDKWEPMYLRRDVPSYADRPLHVRMQIAPIGGSHTLPSDWIYLLEEE